MTETERGRTRYLSEERGEYGVEYGGETEVLEPRPERVYVKGLWEAMMVAEGRELAL